MTARLERNLEIWKSVAGYKGLYEVSSQGRVRALFSACRGRYKSGRLLKPKVINTGYLIVGLYREGDRCKYQTIHKMVLEAFVGLRPTGKEARHLDGVRSNNAAYNLKWGTHRENRQDMELHGTTARGERYSSSKLVNSDVIKIRSLWANGLPARKIGELFGVSAMRAYKVATRKAWRHVQ